MELPNEPIKAVPEPTDYVERLRGLHREVWEGVDPQAYMDSERDAWSP